MEISYIDITVVTDDFTSRTVAKVEQEHFTLLPLMDNIGTANLRLGRCAGSGECALYDGENTRELRYICPVCRRAWAASVWFGAGSPVGNPLTPEH